jgi:hypothetical protein
MNLGMGARLCPAVFDAKDAPSFMTPFKKFIEALSQNTLFDILSPWVTESLLKHQKSDM